MCKKTSFVVLCILMCSGMAFGRVQGDDPSAPIALEAELYQAIEPPVDPCAPYEWVAESSEDFEGYAYTSYMRTYPEGTNESGNYDREPRLDYDVEMTQAGTYYIWARVLAPTSSQNSIHLGDSGVVTADRLNIPDGTWNWVNVANNGDRAIVDVIEPGLVTINCWMRESGCCVDKLLLVSDPNYVPAGIEAMDQMAIRVQNADDPNGLVAMEAELYQAIQPPVDPCAPYEWVAESSEDFEGYAYTSYMRTYPEGTNESGNYDREPRLDYDVEMTQAGTYYIWARVLAPTSSQNSIHLGDSGVVTADRLNIPDGTWNWVNVANDGSRAQVDVNEPGPLTINCWMRESGCCVDRLLLTVDPNYVPDSVGPRDPLVAGIPIDLEPEPLPVISAVPVDDMTFGIDDANNAILTSINGISTDDLLLGVTTGDPAKPGVEDNFIVERDYGNDLDGLHVTMFDVSVSTIFIVEKDGNDSGRFRPLDAEGNPIGGYLPFDSANFSDPIAGVNANGDDMSGTAITAEAEVLMYGIEIWATGLDPYSISAVKADR
ncbi:hypothetical protein ACFL6U_18280 [Planctomycetota bacterium]